MRPQLNGGTLGGRTVATVFLFGAGASAFAGDYVHRRPPLGSELFDELFALGGVASTVSPELAEIFRGNFEAGMAEFQLTREGDTPQLLREMAIYLLDFTPGFSNAYRQLVRILQRKNNSVTLATLNYDMVLERALTSEGNTLCYNGRPRDGSRDFEIIKPHGSCNFLPDLGAGIHGITLLTPPNATGAHVFGPIRPATSPDEIYEFCANNDTVAPAMALFTTGKRLLTSGPFMTHQLKRFAESVKQAHRVVAIGVAVNPSDSHIWLPIQKSSAKLYFVNPDASNFLDWARDTRRRHVYRLAGQFSEAIPRIQRLLSA